MRRILSLLLAAFILLFMVGCNIPTNAGTQPSHDANISSRPIQDNTDTAGPTAPNATTFQEPMNAVGVPIVTETVNSEDGQLLFTYSYQNMTLVVQDPDVADKVIVDFLKRIDYTNQTASEISQSAQNNFHSEPDWIPYLCSSLYSPTRIDRGVLSLFGTLRTYTGGIHPEHTNHSANYDLTTGDVLTLGSIMHKNATKELFSDLVITQLEQLSQTTSLYSNYPQLVKQRFAKEESADEDFYFTTTGLCFYFSPYEIAPYSSGIITVEIPYDSLAGVINDAYFPAEAEFTDGNVNITPFAESDLSQFNQISELILDSGADMYLLYADKTVHNIQIKQLTDSSASVNTVFAANSLTRGDAIMVEATEATLAQLSVTYENIAGMHQQALFDAN